MRVSGRQSTQQSSTRVWGFLALALLIHAVALPLIGPELVALNSPTTKTNDRGGS